MNQLKQFSENGYVVVEGALSPEEVKATNDGMDADAAANPKEWEPGPRPGFVAVGVSAPKLTHRTEALDGMVHHPNIWPLVEAILGEGVECSNLSILRREPCAAAAPEDTDDDPLTLSRRWHREYDGICEGAERNEFFAPGIQVITYLDDVDAQSHCTSFIPESAETKRQLPKAVDENNKWGEGVLRIDDLETAYVHPHKPRWMDSFGREGPRRIGRVDVHAPAGSAVVFNLLNYHCATIRQTERIRRTVHAMYRHREPLHSRHALDDQFASVAEFQAALPKRLRADLS
jgi:hypothetical protein